MRAVQPKASVIQRIDERSLHFFHRRPIATSTASAALRGIDGSVDDGREVGVLVAQGLEFGAERCLLGLEARDRFGGKLLVDVLVLGKIVDPAAQVGVALARPHETLLVFGLNLRQRPNRGNRGGKHAGHPVVITDGDRVELMVVAASTGDRQAEGAARHGIRAAHPIRRASGSR